MDVRDLTTWRLRCGLPAQPPAGPTGPPRCDLSASKVKLVDTCDLAYSLGRVEKLDERPTEARIRGHLVHRVLDLVSRPRLARTRTDCPSEDELRRALATVAGSGSYASGVIAAAWEVLEPLTDKLDLTHVIAVEENFVVTVPQDAAAGPEFKLGGAFDRLDVHEDAEAGGVVLHIHDYNSGAFAASVGDLLRDPQPLFYVAAVAAGGWTGPVRVTFHYLGAEVPTTFLAPPDMARRGLDLAAIKMAEIRAKKAAGDWKPTTGSHCTGCDFRTACPAYAKLARVEKPTLTVVVPTGSDADLLREYDRNRTFAKIFKGHQDECGDALRARLQSVDRVIGGGLRAIMTARQLTRLPDDLDLVATTLAGVTGDAAADVRNDLAGLSERRLRYFLSQLDRDTRKKAEIALGYLREVYDTAASLDVRPIVGGF